MRNYTTLKSAIMVLSLLLGSASLAAETPVEKMVKTSQSTEIDIDNNIDRIFCRLIWLGCPPPDEQVTPDTETVR